jgi:hypothetical protein
LTGTLGRFFALSEAYPDLKANQNMMQLTEELSTTENRIAFARQSYNDAVMQYNTRRESFPANLIAGPFGFGAKLLNRGMRGCDSIRNACAGYSDTSYEWQSVGSKIEGTRTGFRGGGSLAKGPAGSF